MIVPGGRPGSGLTLPALGLRSVGPAPSSPLTTPGIVPVPPNWCNNRGVTDERGGGLGALEARLAQLRREMEHGLPERGAAIREVAGRLRAADTPEIRAELRTHAHRLRGVAGTH